MQYKPGERVRFNWGFENNYFRGEGTVLDTTDHPNHVGYMLLDLTKVEPDWDTVETNVPEYTKEDDGMPYLFLPHELQPVIG